MDNHFSNREINKGRQYEFDLVKTFIIVMMIWTHVYEDLSNFFEPSASAYNAYYHGAIFGASTFMLCMGMGMVYTRSSTSQDYYKRGLHLFFVGIILNIARQVLPTIVTGTVFRDPGSANQYVLLFGVDILQFAGLAFLLMALLRRIGLKYRHILIVSILMSAASYPLEGLETGNFFIDQALGYIWGNNTESYFPLMNWFIFVAAGCWFGKLYLHLQDKAWFHRIAFPVGLVITMTYLLVCFNCDQSVFLQFSEEIYLAHRILPDAIMSILANVWLISFFYYIGKLIPEKYMKVLTHPSKHINQYYCISWVIICFIYNGFPEILPLTNDSQTILMWFCVLSLTILTVVVYDKYLQEKFTAFINRYHTAWVISILVLWLVAGLYGYFVCDGQYPNFLNGYLF